MEYLKGNETSSDLKEIIEKTLIIILKQAKMASSSEERRKIIKDVIESGKSFEKFKELIIYQKGDIDFLLSNKFFNPKFKHKIKASKDGILNIKSTV